ncbi:MAG: TolC family protein, partial [Prevotella sp.]|nr:TolC family protein [Prevotella sp.]
MKRLFHVSVLLILIATTVSAHEWTLQECINHALQYNTDLRKTVISKLSSQEDVLQSKADLLPSLTATTSQNVTYRPWTQSGSSTVANGYAVSSVDKVYYNGSYGINANWTLWNGNKNRNTVKLNKLKEQAAELDSAETANML